LDEGEDCMITINRNDPCSCGSGKKYKKCCQLSKPTQLTDILSSELALQQEEILTFALEEFEIEIEEMLETLPIHELPEEAIHLLEHFIALDCLFSYENVLADYLRVNASKIKRPRTRQIVETWKDGFPSLVRVVEQQSPIHYVVSEIITNKKFSITLLNERNYEINELLFGFYVAYGSAYTIFTEVLNFAGEDAMHGEKAVKAMYQEDPTEDVDSFYRENFINILVLLFYGTVEELIKDLDWDNESQQLVAELIKVKLEALGAPQVIIQLGVSFWYKYCQRTDSKRIQKPILYVVAIQYIVDSATYPYANFSKKEYAEEYDLSVSSLSSKIREIEALLEDDIEQLKMMIEEEEDEFEFDFENDFGFDFEEDEEDLPFGNQPSQNELQAQQLIYEALEASTSQQRNKLAAQALKLDPNCVDAFTLLAEGEKNLDKKVNYLETGLKVAKQQLGEKFIAENKGHFWGIFETRPYMRVKLSLALFLLEVNQPNEAIQHLEELLELNPNDNQGVRYTMMIAYFKTGELDKVSELFTQYNMDDASTAYGKVLIEYHKKGITKNLKKVLDHAKKVNQHVLPYLLNEKKLPTKPPEYSGFGDENEAISYVQDFGEFWWNQKELLDWIR
jgi:uncharacterized protein YecA (UPF0149 family)